MSETITVFEKHELPVECSRIEVKNYYGDGRFSFEITCIHCKIKSSTPQLILQSGKLLCPNCQEEL